MKKVLAELLIYSIMVLVLALIGLGIESCQLKKYKVKEALVLGKYIKNEKPVSDTKAKYNGINGMVKLNFNARQAFLEVMDEDDNEFFIDCTIEAYEKIGIGDTITINVRVKE